MLLTESNELIYTKNNTISSRQKVRYKCDRCNNELNNRTWWVYKKSHNRW